jgi:hypothetical protein
MNRKFAPIVVLLILALTTLACGLGGQKASPTSPPAPTNTPEPPPTPEPELGEEYRSDEGGFAFKTIPDYAVEEFFGWVSMEAPGADPEVGPAILLMNDVNEESITTEQLFDDFVQDIETDVQVSEPQEVTVGGLPGLAADLNLTYEDTEAVGRVVFVAVPPTRSFSAIGVAPSERWDELAPLFEAVLASLTFFEPTSSVEPTSEVGLIRQWAVTATASSEFSNPDWAAPQATGAQDTFECGDQITAWASSSSTGVDWLELGYETPVYATEVNIIQTYNPDQVVKVELLDTEGTYYEIYTGEPVEMAECPYTLSIAVDTYYQVVGVKITVDQSVIGWWNEIDAVELVGY